MRRVIAFTTAAGLLVTLSACTVGAPSGGCTPAYGPGDASEAVSVSGAVGSAPVVDFPTPLISDGLQVSVVTAGDGETVQDGDLAMLTATVLDASTGETLFDTNAASLRAHADGQLVEQALECATVGSRIVATVPGTDGSAAAVYVLDVDKKYTTHATGRIEMPQEGFPSVVTAPDGTPGMTIVGDAPTELKYTTLVTGDGERTKAGDSLLVQYMAVNWSSRAVLKSTWDEDGQVNSILLQPFDASTGGIAAGAAEALTGVTVGSQVLVILPPGSYDTGSDIGIADGSTVAVVYDVLGIL